MAYEVLARIMMKMPTEKRRQIWKKLSPTELREVLEELPKEQLQKILKGLSTVDIQDEMPKDPSIANS